MPFGTPDTGVGVRYGITALGDATEVPGGHAHVLITVGIADGAGSSWTEAGMDEVAQRLLDLLAGADFLNPGSSAGWRVGKTVTTNEESESTPTEEP